MKQETSSSKILYDFGLKRTRGRKKVYEVLMRSPRPLSGSEIQAQLRAGTVDPASVYRILNTFFEKGLVHRIEGLDKITRFALDRGESIHPHFSCRSCGRMECLKDVPVPAVSINREGYVVEEEGVLFQGICARCNSKN
jgi:Fur family ferric uptake transcriptional regulator